LGWKVIHEDSDVVGFKSKSNGDLWFYDDGKKKDQTNYDNIGMNHLAIRVENQKDIDALVTYLEKEKVELLFDTPRHRAEFSTSDDETYYQVMFTSPDNILFEVVYIGKKVS
jgi:catechol 2,3-dioxygenase-like lactoylglutathione lyase family enzyme